MGVKVVVAYHLILSMHQFSILLIHMHYKHVLMFSPLEYGNTDILDHYTGWPQSTPTVITQAIRLKT